MVLAPQAIMSAKTFFFFNTTARFHPNKSSSNDNLHLYRIRAASTDDADCNDEECAPDKEVGKVSMEWLATEKTRVVGTFPPRKKGWTGYVEKDTAGQTNIYSIEPTIYVAESAISSGTSGSSADGAENTAAITAGIALITVAAASSLLLQLSKSAPPQIQTVEYSGPSLTYYINKFKPPETIPASISTEPEAVATEPEAISTKSEAVATEPEAISTKSEAVATEPEAVSKETEAAAPVQIEDAVVEVTVDSTPSAPEVSEGK